MLGSKEINTIDNTDICDTYKEKKLFLREKKKQKNKKKSYFKVYNQHPPRLSTPCHSERDYPPRSSDQNASTRRAQLSSRN